MKREVIWNTHIRVKVGNAFFLAILLFFAGLSLTSGNNRIAGQSKNILVVGFANNVLSDFFPKVSLAENINVAPDQFDALLHRKLVSGFGSLPNGTHNFIVVEDYVKTLQIRQMLHLKGDNPELHTDPSSSGTQALLQIMQQYQADYLLVFRQYHFKWQDEPFSSLFHILNYSVLDQNMTEVFNGQEHFNTFSNFNLTDLERQFARAIRRNATQVKRSIQ